MARKTSIKKTVKPKVPTVTAPKKKRTAAKPKTKAKPKPKANPTLKSVSRPKAKPTKKTAVNPRPRASSSAAALRSQTGQHTEDAHERRARSRRNEDIRSGGQRPLEQRRYPRYAEEIDVTLFRMRTDGRRNPQHSFHARVRSHDLSVNGMYLESTFYLKKDLLLELRFTLPGLQQEIHLKGRVAHVLDDHNATQKEKPSGFAIAFEHYHGESEIILRSYLARGDLHGFVERFMHEHLSPLPKAAHFALVEMIVRWEMLQESLRPPG